MASIYQPNAFLSVHVRPEDGGQGIDSFSQHISNFVQINFPDQKGVIYTHKFHDAQLIADVLNSKGLYAAAYHNKQTESTRRTLEEFWQSSYQQIDPPNDNTSHPLLSFNLDNCKNENNASLKAEEEIHAPPLEMIGGSKPHNEDIPCLEQVVEESMPYFLPELDTVFPMENTPSTPHPHRLSPCPSEETTMPPCLEPTGYTEGVTEGVTNETELMSDQVDTPSPMIPTDSSIPPLIPPLIEENQKHCSTPPSHTQTLPQPQDVFTDRQVSCFVKAEPGLHESLPAPVVKLEPTISDPIKLESLTPHPMKLEATVTSLKLAKPNPVISALVKPESVKPAQNSQNATSISVKGEAVSNVFSPLRLSAPSKFQSSGKGTMAINTQSLVTTTTPSQFIQKNGKNENDNIVKDEKIINIIVTTMSTEFFTHPSSIRFVIHSNCPSSMEQYSKHIQIIDPNLKTPGYVGLYFAKSDFEYLQYLAKKETARELNSQTRSSTYWQPIVTSEPNVKQTIPVVIPTTNVVKVQLPTQPPAIARPNIFATAMASLPSFKNFKEIKASTKLANELLMKKDPPKPMKEVKEVKEMKEMKTIKPEPPNKNTGQSILQYTDQLKKETASLMEKKQVNIDSIKAYCVPLRCRRVQLLVSIGQKVKKSELKASGVPTLEFYLPRLGSPVALKVKKYDCCDFCSDLPRVMAEEELYIRDIFLTPAKPVSASKKAPKAVQLFAPTVKAEPRVKRPYAAPKGTGFTSALDEDMTISSRAQGFLGTNSDVSRFSSSKDKKRLKLDHESTYYSETWTPAPPKVQEYDVILPFKPAEKQQVQSVDESKRVTLRDSISLNIAQYNRTLELSCIHLLTENARPISCVDQFALDVENAVYLQLSQNSAKYTLAVRKILTYIKDKKNKILSLKSTEDCTGPVDDLVIKDINELLKLC